jgi:hypothetical protein
MDADLDSAESEEPKHSTQVISLFVGALLFIVGLSGILFEGFAGLHLNSIYSTIIAVSGALLFYTGYKNKSLDAFLSCLFFSIFYGLQAIAGWVFGKPGVPSIGLDNFDQNWITFIPNVHELGRNDHILNSILSLVLLGGAIDWWRRHSEGGKQKNTLREIQRDVMGRVRGHPDKVIRH